MKLAILQPYFFPYIGYFQLINAVDKFIVYDDVQFMKGGWINRNRIFNPLKPLYITVPLRNPSILKTIREVRIADNDVLHWKTKIANQLKEAYHRAPYFEVIYPQICKVIFEEQDNISTLATLSLKTICALLDIQTPFLEASTLDYNRYLRGQARVLEICMNQNTETYINPIGGIELYSKEQFSNNNIDLFFIKSKSMNYRQFNYDFSTNLSIIDNLMFNDLDIVRKQLLEYELV